MQIKQPQNQMQSDRTCGREQSNIYFLQDAIGAVGCSPPSVLSSILLSAGTACITIVCRRAVSSLSKGVVSAPVSRRVMGGTSSRITGKLLTYRSIFIVFEFLNKSIWTEKKVGRRSFYRKLQDDGHERKSVVL